MLANLLPEYLSLGIPIGLMLGILLAFRKLALSSELDALRGIGIGFGRLLRVPYAYAIVADAAQLRHRQLCRALCPLPLRRPALRPSFGRARRGDQGRRVQPARPTADLAHRPQRGSRHPADGHLRPGRRPLRARRSRRPPRPAASSPPTIPTRSCFACTTASWSRNRPNSRRRGRWRSTATTCRSSFRASIASARAATTIRS